MRPRNQAVLVFLGAERPVAAAVHRRVHVGDVQGAALRQGQGQGILLLELLRRTSTPRTHHTPVLMDLTCTPHVA